MAARQVITYKQLLKMAHDKGLQSIRTELIQLPTEGNRYVAVMRATVTLEGGQQFDGTADATPDNVAPAMQTCLPRMAETRAKARALRDAVGVGEVAAEELDSYGGGDDAPAYGGGRTAQKPTKNAASANGPLVDSQRTAIAALCKRAEIALPADIDDWTAGKAAAFITEANNWGKEVAR